MKQIHFTNTCQIDETRMSREEISFRRHSDYYIQKAIEASDFFSSESQIEVNYFQEGIGSIVALACGDNGKTAVFKTIQSSRRVNAELFSYKKFKEINLRAPEIYETGEVDGYAYYIMEYYDLPTYRDLIDDGKVDLGELGSYMGEVLVRLESIACIGLGIPVEEKEGVLFAEELDLNTYLKNEFNSEEYSHLIGEYVEGVDWSNIASTKISYLSTNLEKDSVLGNFDFGARHFFVSETPILFDPDTELVPEYFSAAFFITPELGYSAWKLDLQKIAIKTYRNKKHNFDIEAFQSAFWLLVYRKCFRLVSLPSEQRVNRALHMLGVIADSKKLQEYLRNIFSG